MLSVSADAVPTATMTPSSAAFHCDLMVPLSDAVSVAGSKAIVPALESCPAEICRDWLLLS